MTVLAPLREARAAAGLTYDELARRARAAARARYGRAFPGARLALDRLVKIELGYAPPDLATGYAIAAGLGVPLDAIWPSGRGGALRGPELEAGAHPVVAAAAACGLTAPALAAATGLSRSAVHKIMQGRRGLSMLSAVALARAFGISTHALAESVLDWQRRHRRRRKQGQ